jgi:acyl-CoA dehydrogenase
VNFDLPDHLPPLLERMDAFIEAEIMPLQARYPQFFDERREFARTDLGRGGLPSREWEELLTRMRAIADAAGWLRYGLPASLGGQDGTNLDMAVIREHLATRGLGLHNDLQDESSIVGNFPMVIMMERFGTDAQRETWTQALIAGKRGVAFGLTEPGHGTDATWLESTARRDGDGWRLNGAKRFNTGVHRATEDLIFARTSGRPGDAKGITAFLVPVRSPGFEVPFYWWTFNMPTDHAEVVLNDVYVPPAPSSDRWTAGWTSRRRSSTRTGSGRRPPVSARPSTASARPSRTPRSASSSAARWPSTRPSSGRWSSCRPRRRWSGCSSGPRLAS